jgi:hypothetical protein
MGLSGEGIEAGSVPKIALALAINSTSPSAACTAVDALRTKKAPATSADVNIRTTSLILFLMLFIVDLLISTVIIARCNFVFGSQRKMQLFRI